MKKVLSFVLVLAMILGSVSMVFATAYTPTWTTETAKVTAAVPFDDAKTNYAATILRDLGAVDGDGTGNVNLEGELTRAEGYAFLVKAMGFKTEGEVKQATKFTDVAKNAWYSGYVAVAAAQGYTDGTSNKTFSPDAKMSMDQVIAAVFKVLGYEDKHLEGVWPTNYRDLAIASGILGTDLEVGTQVATRGDMVQLLYNALNFKQVKWVESILEGNKYDHAVNALTLAQKMTGKNVGDQQITDDGTYRKGNVTVLEHDLTFNNGFDGSAYYGLPVTPLTKTVSGKTYTIGLYSTSGILLTGSFVKGSSATGVATFKAIDGTLYTFASKQVMAKGDVVKNNYVGRDTNAQNLEMTDKVVYTLGVELDKTNAKKIATVYSQTSWVRQSTVMVNATEAAYFADVNVASLNAIDTTSFKYNFKTTDKAIDDDTQVLDETFALVVEGDVTKLSDIKENDIVEIFTENRETDAAKYITKLVVTRNVVEGAVTAKSTIDKTITVNGKSYSFADKTTISEGMKLNNSAVSASTHALYLDSEGKVAYATIPGFKAVLSDVMYAIVRNVGYQAPKTAVEIDDTNLDTIAQISLIIPGEAEAKIYTPTMTATYVDLSNLAQSTIVVADPETPAQTFKQDIVGTVVKVQFDDKDQIVSLFAISPVNKANVVVTPNADGLKYTNTNDAVVGKLYADDVVVVEYQNTDATLTNKKSGFYKFVSKDSLLGYTIKANNNDTASISAIYVNAAGKIDFIAYAKDLKTAVNGVSNVVTVAAFTNVWTENVDGATVTFASFKTQGADTAVKYKVDDARYTTALGSAKFGTVFKLTLDGEYVAAARVYNKDAKDNSTYVVVKNHVISLGAATVKSGNIVLSQKAFKIEYTSSTAADGVVTVTYAGVTTAACDATTYDMVTEVPADIDATYALNGNVMIYKFSATAVTVASADDVKTANSAILYDTDGDEFIDVVLLNYVDMNEWVKARPNDDPGE